MKEQQDFTPVFSEMFKTGIVPQMRRELLVAEASMAWGLCMAGHMPPNFGEVMAQIGMRLGVVASPQNISRLADEIIASFPKGETA